MTSTIVPSRTAGNGRDRHRQRSASFRPWSRLGLDSAEQAGSARFCFLLRPKSSTPGSGLETVDALLLQRDTAIVVARQLPCTPITLPLGDGLPNGSRMRRGPTSLERGALQA